MKQVEVFEVIRSERSYQDAKWGHPAVRQHEVGGWITLMRVHLSQAETNWASSSGDESALDEIRKVLAIGVACFEQQNRVPARSLSDFDTVKRAKGADHA